MLRRPLLAAIQNLGLERIVVPSLRVTKSMLLVVDMEYRLVHVIYLFRSALICQSTLFFSVLSEAPTIPFNLARTPSRYST